MDDAYKELYETIKSKKHIAGGFRNLDPLMFRKFLITFYMPPDDYYISDSNPLLITCDYKIGKDGKPYLIEMERMPQNIIAQISQCVDCDTYEEILRNPGFNEFITLENLMKKWSEFDYNRKIPFAPHLSVIADEKRLTHDALEGYMPRLLDLRGEDVKSIIVQKHSAGTRGRGVHIKRVEDVIYEMRLGSDTIKDQFGLRTFTEEYIPGKTYKENGLEFEQCYRSVFLLGLKGGKIAAEPMVTYARTSSVPLSDNGNLDEMLKVNISNELHPGIKIPAEDDDAKLLEETSEKILLGFAEKATENFRMSDLVGKRYLFNLSNATAQQPKDACSSKGRWDRYDWERARVMDEEFAGWAIYSPRWWGIDKMYNHISICRTPVETYFRMINIHKPDLLLINEYKQAVDETSEGWQTYRMGKISLDSLRLPKERIITNPYKGLHPDNFRKRIVSAKRKNNY